jgi:nucleotide-binding universal stress UspA family protein
LIRAPRFPILTLQGEEVLAVLASILIGLDISHDDDGRLDFAIGAGKRTGATLVGLGVIDEPGIRAIEPAWPVGGKPGVDPVYYRGYQGRLDEVSRQIDLVLERFAARCGDAGLAHFELKASGSPDEIIEREAQECDLIVLGRTSRFRFVSRDNESDDTVKKVLKNAPRPVVITPGSTYPTGPAVVAHDGSLQSARALAAFEATGIAESGQVHVVTMDANSLDATRHADRAVKFLGKHKIEAIPHVLGSSAEPAQTILEQVRGLRAGLLVMGAYGQPALREFFIGSVTRTMLSVCPVPVFCYH